MGLRHISKTLKGVGMCNVPNACEIEPHFNTDKSIQLACHLCAKIHASEQYPAGCHRWFQSMKLIQHRPGNRLNKKPMKLIDKRSYQRLSAHGYMRPVACRSTSVRLLFSAFLARWLRLNLGFFAKMGLVAFQHFAEQENPFFEIQIAIRPEIAVTGIIALRANIHTTVTAESV